MTDTTQETLEWEKEFNKKFNVLKYEQDGELHEGFRTSKVPNSKDIVKFIEHLLSLKDAEIAKLKEQYEI